MDNTREKLIELLDEIACKTDDEQCQKCVEQDCVRCAYENVADHLIANGVTLQEHDCFWATEQAYKNGYAKGYADCIEENAKRKSKIETKCTDFGFSGWIPVSERLPERNTEVLVCDTREDYVSIWGYIGDELWFGEEITWATEDITHWMPLPEPPKGE